MYAACIQERDKERLRPGPKTYAQIRLSIRGAFLKNHNPWRLYHGSDLALSHTLGAHGRTLSGIQDISNPCAQVRHVTCGVSPVVLAADPLSPVSRTS